MVWASGASGDGFSPPIPSAPPAELTLLALFDAYFDCRRQKRNTLQQIEFEADLERNLMALWRELQDGSYQIGPSIAFVVTHPKTREVWAANFRDRVVHHLIHNAVSQRFYNRFIRDSYACIPGRGAHDACRRVGHFARSLTRNWTQPAYVLKADIANFFTSINRHTVLAQAEQHIPEEWARRLLRQVVLHDPRPTAIFRSTPALFDKVPRHKSLLRAPDGYGLPIGNLTSQFLANVHLNALDQYAKHALKARFYGRYVDDVIMFASDPDILNAHYARMDAFLETRLGLHFHPNKKQLRPAHQGVDFVGFFIKPGRTYLRAASLMRCRQRINKWTQNGRPTDNREQLVKLAESVTSYLGMLRQVNGYNARAHICGKFDSLFIRGDDDCKKLVVP